MLVLTTPSAILTFSVSAFPKHNKKSLHSFAVIEVERYRDRGRRVEGWRGGRMGEEEDGEQGTYNTVGYMYDKLDDTYKVQANIEIDS